MNEQKRRVNSRTGKKQHTDSRYYYVEGNAVRKLEELPEKMPRKKADRSAQRKIKKNREKAMRMGRGYILFLCGISAITLATCVGFLKNKAILATQNKEIAVLESEWNQLRTDNDAYYNATLASADLTDMETKAERLGLHAATEGQIIYYDTAGSSYVRQYQDVPASR